MFNEEKFFLKLPTKEEVIDTIGEISDEYYTTMQSSFPFITYNDIWLYYNGFKNLPKGCRCCGFDDTNYHMVDKKMINTAGLMGCKLKNDLTVSSTFHPFAQVLCCKGESSASYVAMSLSFTAVLKIIFGASSVVLDSPDFFNVDFSDALVKGIRKCHPESLIEFCFFH